MLWRERVRLHIPHIATFVPILIVGIDLILYDFSNKLPLNDNISLEIHLKYICTVRTRYNLNGTRKQNDCHMRAYAKVKFNLCLRVLSLNQLLNG